MWRETALVVVIACLVYMQFHRKDGFTAYTGGSFDFTSSNVNSDPCPFRDDAAVLAAAAVGAPLACAPQAAAGLDGLFLDRASPGTLQFCVEVPHGQERAVRALLALYGKVSDVSAPTVQALMAVPKQGTTSFGLLLASQEVQYGGASVTAPQMDAFGYTPVKKGTSAQAMVRGILVTCASESTELAAEKVLRDRYGSSSALCNTRCSGDDARRCGCKSTPGGARCMGSSVDYVSYDAPKNASDYWVAYRLRL